MKKIKPFLLLGLIFALVCSVSFAAPPPGKATLIEFKKDVSVPIDLAVTPAITIKISEFAFDDLRQHRAESYDCFNIYTKKELPAAPAVAKLNDLNYAPPFNLYGEINKNQTVLIRRPDKIANYKIIVQRRHPQKNIIPPLPAACNKRE